ncbi:MAG: E3 binding domain-containing protein, partial [Verrucomicrobia bacterium]|nr:E3 binding domain-containing protein [Verrucomicrobiota bacterium]
MFPSPEAIRVLPIIMPQLGESIAEATIVRAAFAVGDRVEADTDLLEVETNKAVMGVTAPWKKKKAPGTAGVDAEKFVKNAVEPTVSGLPVPAHAGGASFLSPRMKARMAELGLHAADLAGVAGSGAGGRVTIDDLERFLQDLERNTISAASSMRVAVADAMRRSWTRPLATVVLPVQLDILLAHRKKPTVTAGPARYALRALALALSETPAVAGRLLGDRVIHPR